MLESFIQRARLRLWMSREDSPETIRESKKLLDKDFPMKDYKFSKIVAFPPDLVSLVKYSEGSLHAYHRVEKVVYARSSTHIGDSLISYYPRGQAASLPMYGSIQYIYSIEGEVRFAVRRHKPASVSFDPFARFPYFPAKLYQSRMDELEIVGIDGVIGHFARWQFTDDLVVVLPLLRD